MSKPVGIVDLFSGPGGLGEGFASLLDSAGLSRFSLEVSIEKEQSAHATLLLRSFIRKFGNNLPPEYHEFLNGSIKEPDWHRLYPNEWMAAKEEVKCLELGTTEAKKFLKYRIACIRAKYGDRIVLIGGPPCQPYSLAGRARNAGISGYVPHKDDRHFLYREYVEVIAQLQPAAFVMENVKGVLSSFIHGDMIFHKILSDLQSAAGTDSYKLVALSRPEACQVNLDTASPDNFIIRMEDYGVPQTRHRVIVVGLRSDVASVIPDQVLPYITRQNIPVSVDAVIGSMPRLRSGLSKDDSAHAWFKMVRDGADLVRHNLTHLSKQQRKYINCELDLCIDRLLKESINLNRFGGEGTALSTSCPDELREWIVDENLIRLPNNDTRGHMSSDLARYLFVSVFGKSCGRSPRSSEFPDTLAPNHRNWRSGKFIDRFRVQLGDKPASTITSHISKDGHYFIHPDPTQCRSLTVREAARLQTFPDNYFFKGGRTHQYVQVGNAVPPFLARQIAKSLWRIFQYQDKESISAHTIRMTQNNTALIA